jgi:hypothetical protein
VDRSARSISSGEPAIWRRLGSGDRQNKARLLGMSRHFRCPDNLRSANCAPAYPPSAGCSEHGDVALSFKPSRANGSTPLRASSSAAARPTSARQVATRSGSRSSPDESPVPVEVEPEHGKPGTGQRPQVAKGAVRPDQVIPDGTAQHDPQSPNARAGKGDGRPEKRPFGGPEVDRVLSE